MNNELYHYGVKGMHWGVRRYQPYPKGYSGSGKYVGKRGRIKGVSNSEAESKRERRKRILLGSAAIAGGAAAIGLTAYGIKKRTDAGKKMHTIMESLERRKASRKNPSVKHLSEQFDKYNKVYDKYDKLVDFAPTLAGASAIPVVVDNIIKRRKQKSKIKGIDDYDDAKRREKLRNRILVGAGAAAGLGLGIYTGRRAYKAKMRNAAQKLRDSELKKELSEAALEKLRLKRKPKEIDIKRAENAIKINSKQLERLRLKQPKIKRAAKRLGVATALSLGASGAGLGYGLTGSFDNKKRRRKR